MKSNQAVEKIIELVEATEALKQARLGCKDIDAELRRLAIEKHKLVAERESRLAPFKQRIKKARELQKRTLNPWEPVEGGSYEPKWVRNGVGEHQFYYSQQASLHPLQSGAWRLTFSRLTPAVDGKNWHQVFDFGSVSEAEAKVKANQLLRQEGYNLIAETLEDITAVWREEVGDGK